MKHIEDLPKDQMLRIVRNLNKMRVTEKIDGSNLVFGFDTDGTFYTTRMNKGKNEKFYRVEDYENTPVNNTFKAAHAALSAALSNNPVPGAHYEVEVLYDRQPNAVVYGSNRIVFITPFPYNPHPVNVVTDMIFSANGTSTFDVAVHSGWVFSQVPTIKLPPILVREDISKEDLKPQLVKEILRKIQPAFRDVDDLQPHEDFGVEGIVIEDNESDLVVKLVDKHTFTLINQFNFAIRNELKAAGPRFNPANNRHLYKSFTATVGYHQTSIYDTMLGELAAMIGIPGLSKYMTITRTLKKYNSVDEFLAAWALYDVDSAKTVFVYVVDLAIDRVHNALATFKTQWLNYELVLTSGQVIKYTDEVKRRTLVVFAEILRELNEIREKIDQSDDWEPLAQAIYGKQMQLAFPNQ